MFRTGPSDAQIAEHRRLFEQQMQVEVRRGFQPAPRPLSGAELEAQARQEMKDDIALLKAQVADLTRTVTDLKRLVS